MRVGTRKESGAKHDQNRLLLTTPIPWDSLGFLRNSLLLAVHGFATVLRLVLQHIYVYIYIYICKHTCMYVYIYIYIYISYDLSLSLSVYIYIYTHVCMVYHFRRGLNGALAARHGFELAVQLLVLPVD